MRVLSYNLRKHRAVGELGGLVDAHEIDVLCVQEAVTQQMPAALGHLRLSAATAGNRLGLAIYASASRFQVDGTVTVALKKSLHDRVLKPANERLLAVRLRDIDAGRDRVVASFHAAPLTARNSVRREQIRVAVDELSQLGPGLPQLIVGDFNYPVFKERLAGQMREGGYELAMSDAHTYTRYRIFRGYYDFAAATGFTIDSVRTLPQGRSDHLPILVETRPHDSAL